MSENDQKYYLTGGESGVIFSKDCEAIRVLIQQRDTLEEAELLAIGISIMASNPAWRRKVCLRAKEVIESGSIKTATD